MKSVEELKKMSLGELEKEEDECYTYYKLIETVKKAKQKGII